jgi:hypothetical protein
MSGGEVDRHREIEEEEPKKRVEFYMFLQTTTFDVRIN